MLIGSRISLKSVLSKTFALSTTHQRCLSFDLSEQQREFQNVSLQFAKDVIIPNAKHYDLTGEFPWDIIKQAHSLGLMNTQVPEKYGMFYENFLKLEQFYFN